MRDNPERVELDSADDAETVVAKSGQFIVDDVGRRCDLRLTSYTKMNETFSLSLLLEYTCFN